MVIGQRVQAVPLARQARRRHVQEAVGVHGQGRLHDRRHRALRRIAPYRPVHGVGEDEGVLGAEPVAHVVGRREARQAQPRRIGDHGRQDAGGGSAGQLVADRLQHRAAVIAEQDRKPAAGDLPRLRRFRGPVRARRVLARSQQLREPRLQVAGGAHQVDRVPPGAPLFLAARRGDAAGQQRHVRLRVVRADVVHQLEHLVARVEQVPALGVEALRRRVGQQAGGVAPAQRAQRRRQRALDPVRVAGADERLQPAGEIVQPSVVAVQRPAQAVRHRPRRLGGDLPGRVVERQVAGVVAQVRRQVGHAGQAYQPLAPACQPARGELGDRGDHAGRVRVFVQQPEQGLRLDQAHADVQPPLQAPAVERRVGVLARAARDQHLPVGDAHLVGRHVVGEQVERAAGSDVEAGVVPVAGQDAVVERSAVQREAHVRAAVVHGGNAVTVGEHGDGDPVALDQDDPLGAHGLDRAGRHVAALIDQRLLCHAEKCTP